MTESVNNDRPSSFVMLIKALKVKKITVNLTNNNNDWHHCEVVPGTARAGPEARPARGHSKLACVCASACTVWRAVGFGWLVGSLRKWRKCVAEMRHENASRKSVTKLPQKSMLREFAKVSEAEIWTRVRRRSPFWKWASIDRVRCCRRSAK